MPKRKADLKFTPTEFSNILEVIRNLNNGLNRNITKRYKRNEKIIYNINKRAKNIKKKNINLFFNKINTLQRRFKKLLILLEYNIRRFIYKIIKNRYIYYKP